MLEATDLGKAYAGMGQGAAAPCLLEATDLRKAYAGRRGAVHALTGVSLTAEAGEFVVVQGPSGCGKTTLLLTVGALLMPTGGRVRVDGREPYSLSPEARARFRATTIGFVFQQFHLVPYLSARDNIAVAALALPKPDVRARTEELMAHFGLTDRAHHVPAELSVGERQRVALARALLNGPKLVLADEPTGNLDGGNAETVLAHLAEFARNGGAVLLVTHDPRAGKYARRVLHMAQGKLVDA